MVERMILEDNDGPPLPEGWERMGPAERFRRQVEIPTRLDAAPLRVIIEAEPGQLPNRYVVEISVDGWLVIHAVERFRGVWTATTVRYEALDPGSVRESPTARQKRRGNLERHRHRIDALLRDASKDYAAIFTGVANEWEKTARFKWGITAPRSKRGRQREVDPDEVQRLRDQGLGDADIARRMGTHPKTPANAVRAAKGRLPWKR